MRSLILALTFLIVLAPVDADDGVTSPDAAAIQAVIQDQLDAFNRDDGVRAFSHASPQIQGIFQTVEIFMSMVRTGYEPVYRSAHAEFGQLHVIENEPVQEVYVTGQDGRSVLAVYTMQQQEDGTWRINGCSLYPVPDLAV